MIIKNCTQTPDGTILRSYSIHDFVSHIDKNGEIYFTDGGTSYIRRSQNKTPAVSLDVYHDDPFEIVREVDFWASYGKSGKEPMKRMSLSEMSYGHIEAILETQHHIPEELAELFKKEMRYRKCP